MRLYATNSSRPVILRARPGRFRPLSVSGQAGPEGAFEPGQESEARRTLFNRIAPVYDDVRRFISIHAWIARRVLAND